jgi:hypothetical protein
VLRGHDGALVDQPAKSRGMDTTGTVWADPKAAYKIEPVQQLDHVRWRGRFRGVARPGETGPAHIRVVRQQPDELLAIGIGQAGCQCLERGPAGADPCLKPNALQDCRGRDEHARGAQMLEHCAHDRLAAVRGPRRIRAHSQAGAPARKSETPHPKSGL